ncbi:MULTISPECIES: helix-turn-helix domain-containing protein [unclassified Streptomyces]|uniref:helix-turn-helix domain-containing protein n=1 Tax=unclassified Streptomyces TaxID=2593676 RepID=UPI0020366110|nr:MULTISPECIES: helix-turn-helix domain-containing protein [unclassified Streptomyces]
MPESRRPYPDVSEMLELLAREAHTEEFERVVRSARDAGADEAELARLTRAKDLSLSIRSLFARRQQREAGLSALVDTARDLTLPYNLDTLLKVITRRARLLLGLDMSWVTFHALDEGCSYVRAADGHTSAITVGFAVPMAGGVGRQARQRSAPFWTADYLRDETFLHSEVIDDVVRAEGLHALMAIPLRHEDSELGNLYVAGRGIRHFDPDEISLMSSLADLAAVAIEKTRLLDQVRSEVAGLELNTSRAMSSSSAAHHLRQVHSKLIDVVLEGGGLHALAAEAATLLGGSVLIRDHAGRDLNTTGEFPELDESEIRAVCLDAHTERRPVRSAAGILIAPAVAGQEMLGTLLLAPHAGTEAESDSAHRTQLLALVAQVTALVLLMQRSAAAAEGQVRDELFNDLLKGNGQAAKLAERAQRLGVDLGGPHVVVVARPEGGSLGRAVIWASSYAHQLSGLKSVEGGCIILMLPGTDPGAAARAVSEELSSALNHPVTVGTAGPVKDLTAISRTYHEARCCLDALTALGGTGGTASPGDLGFLGLLLSDNPNTGEFITSTIGPVLEYDAQQRTELARTLEAYFASAGSPTRAAESLHVHPNTVSRRLERISELLGPDWLEPAQALEVQLALQMQRTRRALIRGRRDQAGHAIG